MNKSNAYSFTIVTIFIVLVFFLAREGAVESRIKGVKIAGQNIKVELAVTHAEQAQGLSGRSALGEGEGMLFVFKEPGEHLFWMQGMNFPIDMIWIDEDNRVIYIKEDAQPENYLETYGPKANAKYVLEVVAGFTEENNLGVGDRVGFTY